MKTLSWNHYSDVDGNRNNGKYEQTERIEVMNTIV